MTRKVIKQKLNKTFFIILVLIGLSATAGAQMRLGGPNIPPKRELKITQGMTTSATDVEQKYELELTPEIAKMLDSSVCLRLKELPDEFLYQYGVKNRSQLLNLHFGKPMANYIIGTQGLTFTGSWEVPVLSDNEPIALAEVLPAGNEQYRLSGFGSAEFAKLIYNYEYKDLIVGFLRIYGSAVNYFYLQKDNKNVFVKTYDYQSRTLDLKSEYSFIDIINSLYNE